MDVLMRIPLLSGWFPSLLAATVVVCLALVAALPEPRRSGTTPGKGSASSAATIAAATIAAGAIGYAVVWFLSDVVMAFGVSVGWMVMTVVAATVSLVALALITIRRSRSARRVVAIMLVPLVVLTCATSINMVYGEYTTVGSALGFNPYPMLDSSSISRPVMSVRQWRLLAAHDELHGALASHGIVRTVHIPATKSGFQTRMATVYLPPAALSATPPRLPVMVLLAGQPGSPTRLMAAGKIAAIMDEYAAHHDGLAPIVVSPDQNGAFTHNSLCADTSVYGEAETYLTTDVPRWIRDTLPVSTSSSQWLIGGFSQGGTCSVQIGPAHPKIFGSIFAASTEIAPSDGSRKRTIDRFFNGDEKAFDAHVPTAIIARHSPSSQTLMMVSGEWDADARSNQARIAKAAKAAGMRVTVMISRRSGHDWHTVINGLVPVVDDFGHRTGLGASTWSASRDDQISIITGSGQ